MRKFLSTIALSTAFLPCSAFAQSYILLPDSTTDVIMLLDAQTGEIVNPTFIDPDPSGIPFAMRLPKDAVQVEDEIWVIDQILDEILRFDLYGNWVATIDPISGMLDNLRGACFANGNFYVTSDGTQNGATENTVIRFSPDGLRTGSFTAGPSPFDVFEWNGELLVSDFEDHTIGRYDYAGNFLGDLHDSDGITGIAGIQQLCATAGGTLLAAGFMPLMGLYEYDATGIQIGFVSQGPLRGALELPSGEVLLTSSSSGLQRYDPVGGVTTTLMSFGNFQFLNPLDQGEPDAFCFGDGGDGLGCTPCPCGNESSVGLGGGCLNSAGSSARLWRSGSPSAANDTLRFEVSGATPISFGILISSDSQLPANMTNPCFGSASGVTSAVLDGLRCVGPGVLRHGTRPSDTSGVIGETTAGWGPPNGPQGGLIAANAFTVGQTRHFQSFYRDDPLAQCGRGQNTTQGLSVTIEP